MAGDWFGGAVALDADTTLIGAYLDDHGSTRDAGSAYVFVRSAVAWSQRAKLIASDAATNDYFGVSVALEGNKALIGAMRDSHAGGNGAGSAYVFPWSGSAWTQQYKLTASDPGTNDNFGACVALRTETAVIGAPKHTLPVGPEAGSAYVFTVLQGYPLGHMNCDCSVNFADIDPFVLALGGEAGYKAKYPNCPWLNADCNCDGKVNFDDIDPFVALLTS